MTARQMDSIEWAKVAEVHIQGRSGTEGCKPGTFCFDPQFKMCSWKSAPGVTYHAQVGSITTVVCVEPASEENE